MAFLIVGLGRIGEALAERARPFGMCVAGVKRDASMRHDATIAVRSIAGAGLDVFAEEPLPATSPLWELPNVIITPHVAGVTPHYYERAAELFADNLERYLAKKPLENLFQPSRGY